MAIHKARPATDGVATEQPLQALRRSSSGSTLNLNRDAQGPLAMYHMVDMVYFSEFYPSDAEAPWTRAWSIEFLASWMVNCDTLTRPQFGLKSSCTYVFIFIMY